METSHYFEWVTNYGTSDRIISLLESPDFLVINKGENPLESGAIRYYYLVASANRESIASIQELINQITYPPLVLTFDMDSVDEIKKRIYTQGLENIILAYLQRQGFSAEETEMTEFNSSVNIKPLTASGLPLYLSHGEYTNLISELMELNSYIGYDLLYPDPLVWYYFNTVDEVESPWDIFIWRGMAVIGFDEREERTMYLRDVNRAVSSLQLDGYFTVQADEELELFAYDWYFKYFYDHGYDTDEYAVFKVTPHQADPYNNRDKNWLINAWRRHKIENKNPIFSVVGEWIQRMEQSLDNMVKLQYAAILSAEDNNLATHSIKCLPNLHINVEFQNLDEVGRFREGLLSYLPQSKTWQVSSCVDECQLTGEGKPRQIIIPANPSHRYIVRMM